MAKLSKDFKEMLDAKTVLIDHAIQEQHTGNTALANKLYMTAGRLRLELESKIYGRVS